MLPLIVAPSIPVNGCLVDSLNIIETETIEKKNQVFAIKPCTWGMIPSKPIKAAAAAISSSARIKQSVNSFRRLPLVQ